MLFPRGPIRVAVGPPGARTGRPVMWLWTAASSQVRSCPTTVLSGGVAVTQMDFLFQLRKL